MMGRQNNDQGPLFYEFRLDEAVPDDHLVRKIDAVLDLSWVYAELAPHYPTLGRPSVDPVLMIRMLIIGYVFGLRSERLLCREVQVNFALGKMGEPLGDIETTFLTWFGIQHPEFLFKDIYSKVIAIDQLENMRGMKRQKFLICTASGSLWNGE
jgi:hypothetical protein